MSEIYKEYKNDQRTVFNLIVTGSSCEKVIDDLIKNNYYEKDIIQHIAVFCMRIENYIYLKEKYNKIDDIYISKYKIKDFIIKYSHKDIKPFPSNELITYDEYQKLYFNSHKKISQYYGNLSPEAFKENLRKLKELIEKDKTNLLKPRHILENAFEKFELKDDLNILNILNEIIIHEYTKNTFFKDLNRWQRDKFNGSSEEVAYFTARLMYSLNNYAQKKGKYYKDKKAFRGITLNFSSILNFEKAKGQIIVLSSFISSSEDINQAKKFCGRDKKRNIKKSINKKFSVLIHITNEYKKNWISNGVNVQEISYVPSEKEILFQPFSFYFLKDVKYDLEKLEADIHLETIGKQIILEEALKRGKKIRYNKDLNIIESF